MITKIRESCNRVKMNALTSYLQLLPVLYALYGYTGADNPNDVYECSSKPFIVHGTHSYTHLRIGPHMSHAKADDIPKEGRCIIAYHTFILSTFEAMFISIANISIQNKEGECTLMVNFQRKSGEKLVKSLEFNSSDSRGEMFMLDAIIGGDILVNLYFIKHAADVNCNGEVILRILSLYKCSLDAKNEGLHGCQRGKKNEYMSGSTRSGSQQGLCIDKALLCDGVADCPFYRMDDEMPDLCTRKSFAKYVWLVVCAVLFVGLVALNIILIACRVPLLRLYRTVMKITPPSKMGQRRLRMRLNELQEIFHKGENTRQVFPDFLLYEYELENPPTIKPLSQAAGESVDGWPLIHGHLVSTLFPAQDSFTQSKSLWVACIPHEEGDATGQKSVKHWLDSYRAVTKKKEEREKEIAASFKRKVNVKHAKVVKEGKFGVVSNSYESNKRSHTHSSTDSDRDKSEFHSCKSVSSQEGESLLTSGESQVSEYDLSEATKDSKQKGPWSHTVKVYPELVRPRTQGEGNVTITADPLDENPLVSDQSLGQQRRRPLPSILNKHQREQADSSKVKRVQYFQVKDTQEF